MVSHTGIEPVTPWLKVMCSTDWANGSYYGAGNEGRTRDIQLGRLTLYHLSYSRIFLVAEIGFEPMTFGLWAQRATWLLYSAIIMVPRAGLEPARNKFPQDFKSCASTDFATKALLYQNKIDYTLIQFLCQLLFFYFLFIYMFYLVLYGV